MLKNKRGVRVGAAAVAAVGLLSACSSGTATSATPSPSSTAGGGDDNPAVMAAKTEYQKFLQPQPAIEVPPLPSKPEAGQTITITGCPLPVCVSLTSSAVEAAKKLDWKVTFQQVALTPQAYQASLDQVLQSPPKMAAVTAVTPNSLVNDRLQALASKGTHISQIAPAGDNPSGPVKAAVNGVPEMAQSGHLMGNAVVADGGAATTVFVWDPSLSSIWGPVREEFTKVVSSAGGKVDVLEVSQANIGKTVPTQVTSYLQSHPKVSYVAFALSDISAGVPQALSAAGLSGRVKLVSRAPNPTTLGDIASGQQWASVAEEAPSNGYRVIDQLARLSMGVPLTGDVGNPAGWHQIYNKSNVPAANTVPAPPGYPEAFLTAWHLT